MQFQKILYINLYYIINTIINKNVIEYTVFSELLSDKKNVLGLILSNVKIESRLFEQLFSNLTFCPIITHFG